MAKDDSGKTLGDMLKNLRKSKKLSYNDVEEKGAISAQLVEDIEKGRIGPSIGALKKICKALEIPLSDFFLQTGLSEDDIQGAESNRDAAYVAKAKRRSLAVKGSRAVIEALTPSQGDNNLELLWQEVEPKSTGGDWLTHPGEECCLVVKGKINLHIEDDLYELSEGDTLWYKTTQRHKWVNPYDQPATLVWAITPPYHSKI